MRKQTISPALAGRLGVLLALGGGLGAGRLRRDAFPGG